ncbi:LamG-like jellyroll fold domain-containing protein [Marinibacterium sp. SX1]|uniref:LamG-like jellyroll fold domain-containing protein n=1 Tax=Marinibacterium sp. SX1 TaxID=3388424 RepID=UPI003D165946
MANDLAISAMVGALPAPYRKGGEHQVLQLGRIATEAEGFDVRAYDFADYRGRWGHDPEAPLYLLTSRDGTGPLPARLQVQFDDAAATRTLAGAVGRADVQITLNADFPGLAPPEMLQLGTEIVALTAIAGPVATVQRGQPGGDPARPHPVGTVLRRRAPVGPPVDIAVPPNLAAGSAIVVPAAAVPAGARLLRFRVSPARPDGAGGWDALVLLGNIARLAWALGREKDALRRTFGDIRRSRSVGMARGATLDLIGRDLAVPRFPPRPHGVDDDTVVLLDLDELDGAGQLADTVALLRPPGHPAQLVGAGLVPNGRFGGGVAVGDPGGVMIPDAPALDTGPGDDMTIELFVRLAERPGSTAILAAKGVLAPSGVLSARGWALAAGPFRGIDGNLRFSVRDASTRVDLFADVPLALDVWHHVAGSVDRAGGQARLYVDGVETALADVSQIGGLANGRPVEIGAASLAGTPRLGIRAVVDGIRLSRVARTGFGPALGEDDDSYARRLAVFRSWRVPSAAGIAEALNRAGPIDGDPAPFIIDESDQPTAIARAELRVVPPEVAAGTTIAADGLTGAPEPLAPDDGVPFQPWMLTRPVAPNLVTAGGDAGRMMRDLANRVETLAGQSLAGQLTVEAAFDAAAGGLAAQGRQVRLRHSVLPPPVLAGLAHRAGFDHVAARSTDIVASHVSGPRVNLVQEAGAARYTDLIVGQGVPVRLDPVVGGARFAWSVIPGATGRAAIRAHPGDGAISDAEAATRGRVGLAGLAPGTVALRGDLTRAGITLSAIRSLRIGLDSLPDGMEIDAEGQVAALGSLPLPAPPARFDERLLHDWDPAAMFGDAPQIADAGHRRMLFSLREILDRLLRQLQDQGAAIAGLVVQGGFDPTATDRALAQGHAVVLSHDTLPPAELGAMAHNVGAALVRHDAGAVTLVAPASPLMGIEAEGLTGQPAPGEILLGTPAGFALSLPPDPGGRDVFWHLGGEGIVSADARTRPEITLSPGAAGRTGLRAVASLRGPEGTQPFTYAVRLNPALEAAGANIPKDVYDFVMNVLTHFSPIGIAIDTTGLRAHVAELTGQTLSQLPRYTFPDFKDR